MKIATKKNPTLKNMSFELWVLLIIGFGFKLRLAVKSAGRLITSLPLFFSQKKAGITSDHDHKYFPSSRSTAQSNQWICIICIKWMYLSSASSPWLERPWMLSLCLHLTSSLISRSDTSWSRAFMYNIK